MQVLHITVHATLNSIFIISNFTCSGMDMWLVSDSYLTACSVPYIDNKLRVCLSSTEQVIYVGPHCNLSVCASVTRVGTIGCPHPSGLKDQTTW